MSTKVTKPEKPSKRLAQLKIKKYAKVEV